MKSTILACTALILTSREMGPEKYVDVGPALDQVHAVIRDFAIANEFHHAELNTFTDDLSQLQGRLQWSHPDSVELSVVEAGAEGWAVVGTHVRLGDGIGCAMAWGRPQESISTPGGVPFGGGNQILCDEVPGRDNR